MTWDPQQTGLMEMNMLRSPSSCPWQWPALNVLGQWATTKTLTKNNWPSCTWWRIVLPVDIFQTLYLVPDVSFTVMLVRKSSLNLLKSEVHHFAEENRIKKPSISSQLQERQKGRKTERSSDIDICITNHSWTITCRDCLGGSNHSHYCFGTLIKLFSISFHSAITKYRLVLIIHHCCTYFSLKFIINRFFWNPCQHYQYLLSSSFFSEKWLNSSRHTANKNFNDLCQILRWAQKFLFPHIYSANYVHTANYSWTFWFFQDGKYM